MKAIESQPAGLLDSLRFSLFFASRRLRRPQVRQPACGARPPGYFEAYRAESFQWLNPHDVIRRTGEPWSKLGCSVYLISHRDLSAVLAVYGPGTILWLDDHSDDSDFQEFARREGLSAWLPDRPHDLASLLCATKLNYLGEPRLLQDASDIPAVSQEEKASWASDPKALDTLARQEKQLKDAAGQIAPLSCVPRPDGACDLTLWVWTRLLGRLIYLHCSFDQAGCFSFGGTQRTAQVGKFLVPR